MKERQRYGQEWWRDAAGGVMRVAERRSMATTIRTPRHFDWSQYQERFGVDYGTTYRVSGAPFGKELPDLWLQESGPHGPLPHPVFRFDTPSAQRLDVTQSYISASTDGKRAVIPGERKQSWAWYDTQTGALVEHGAGSLRPTEQELHAWGEEARHLADQWRGRLDMLRTHDLYIRFGRMPPNGQSRNYAENRLERGVSAYDARINPRSGMVEFGGTVNNWGTLVGLMDRTPYLVTGKRLGLGSDGEPVIAEPKRLARLKYDKTSKEFAAVAP